MKLFLIFCIVFTPLVALSQTPSFEKLDQNGDGVITKEEYELLETYGSEQTSEIDENDEQSQSDTEETGKTTKPIIGLRESFLSGDSLFSNAGVLLEAGNDDPAKFAWSVSDGDNVYNVDAAAIFNFLSFDNTFDYQKGDRWLKGLLAVPVIEAHVSSSDQSPNNSIKAEIPFIFSFNDAQVLQNITSGIDPGDEPESGWITQHFIIGSPKFETERDFDTKILGLDLLYSPTIPDIGIGRSIQIWKFNLRFRPLVGFEFGNVLDDGGNSSNLPEENFVRITARLRSELQITKSLFVNIDYVHRTDLTGNQDSFNFLDLSGIFYLDEKQKISIGTSYNVGENSPTFQEVDELSAWLGVKL